MVVQSLRNEQCRFWRATQLRRSQRVFSSRNTSSTPKQSRKCSTRLPIFTDEHRSYSFIHCLIRVHLCESPVKFFRPFAYHRELQLADKPQTQPSTTPFANC